MLGRIAESAGLGHSFRHNALMKWSAKKESKQQKGPHHPPQHKTKQGWFPQKIKKRDSCCLELRGERKFPAADFLSLKQSH